MARHKNALPRAMRLEAMSKEQKGLSKGHKSTTERGTKVPKFPPKGVRLASLPLAHLKPHGKGRGSKNVPDSVLEAPNRKRARAAKPKK